jgi:MoxR-like ATPase
MALPTKPQRLKPTRLHLVKTPTGPYARLLRRPWPEVVALGEGKTAVLLRGTKVVRAIPLWASQQASYYARGVRGGWVPEDFKDENWARQYVGADAAQVEYIALPVAHLRLANDESVCAIAEVLSPWRGESIERWRGALKGDLWLTVVRVYSFDPVFITLQQANRLHAKVRPFRTRNMNAVLSDAAWEKEMKKIEAAVEGARVGIGVKEKPQIPITSYGIEQVAGETGIEKEEITRYIRVIKRKKQLVFSGPPGTGKSYLAGKLARLMVAQTTGFSETIQFHPSYAYEDFVQGLRPLTRRGRVVYELLDGAFLRFCRRADSVRPAPCVLVIEELNRAPLARVLGELIYLLEYRQDAVELAGGENFSIPDNVYIVGTMNAADRSIALVDQAIIRRFAFISLAPNYEVLAKYLTARGLESDSLVELLREINECIGNEDLLLGTSFFMSGEGDLVEDIGDIWQTEIEPYLREALYDRPREWAKYRWRNGVEHRLREWKP